MQGNSQEIIYVERNLRKEAGNGGILRALNVLFIGFHLMGLYYNYYPGDYVTLGLNGSTTILSVLYHIFPFVRRNILFSILSHMFTALWMFGVGFVLVTGWDHLDSPATLRDLLTYNLPAALTGFTLVLLIRSNYNAFQQVLTNCKSFNASEIKPQYIQYTPILVA